MTTTNEQKQFAQEETQVTALFEQAWTLFDQKRYKDCLSLLENAIAIAPKYGALYILQGRAYHGLREYKQAKQAYKKAYDLEPCNWEILVDLAITLVAEGKYERAIELYSGVARMELETEEKATIYFNRAFALSMKGELQQAIKDYSCVVDLAPASTIAAGALLNRGTVRSRLGQANDALADYQNAYALQPDESNIAWVITWACHIGKTPTEEILSRLGAVEAIDPDSYTADLCRGVTALSLGNALGALEHFTRAQELEPDQWDPSFWQGLAYAFQHDQRAQQTIENARDLGLPPVLLTPLYWIQSTNQEFFGSYAAPLLQSAGL